METWRILFYGDLLEGHTLNSVKTQLIKLFSASSERIEKMFSGQEYVIRKGIPKDKLDQYLSVLAEIGLKVYPQLEVSQYMEIPETQSQAVIAATPKSDIQSQVSTNVAASLQITLEDKEVTCPRCSCIQPKRTLCKECGLDMPRYWEAVEKNKEELKARKDIIQRQQASEVGQCSIRASNVYDYNSQAQSSSGDYFDQKLAPPPQLGLSFEGRWGRVSYLQSWFTTLFVAFLGGVFAGILSGLIPIFGLIFIIPIGIGVALYNIRIVVLRLHDLGLSGWWIVLMICLAGGSGVFWPLIIPYLLFVLCTIVWPGQKHGNHYGSPPEMGSLLTLILCIVIFVIVPTVIFDSYKPDFEEYKQTVKQKKALEK